MKGFAILKKDSPFFELFPEGKAPVLPLGPEQVRLEGLGEAVTYMLDVNRLTDEQMIQVAAAVAKQHNSSAAEVLEFLKAERRLPIRTSQVERTEGMGIDMRMVI